jgi:hypothetical protein
LRYQITEKTKLFNRESLCTRGRLVDAGRWVASYGFAGNLVAGYGVAGDMLPATGSLFTVEILVNKSMCCMFW